MSTRSSSGIAVHLLALQAEALPARSLARTEKQYSYPSAPVKVADVAELCVFQSVGEPNLAFQAACVYRTSYEARPDSASDPPHRTVNALANCVAAVGAAISAVGGVPS